MCFLFSGYFARFLMIPTFLPKFISSAGGGQKWWCFHLCAQVVASRHFLQCRQKQFFLRLIKVFLNKNQKSTVTPTGSWFLFRRKLGKPSLTELRGNNSIWNIFRPRKKRNKNLGVDGLKTIITVSKEKNYRVIKKRSCRPIIIVVMIFRTRAESIVF